MIVMCVKRKNRGRFGKPWTSKEVEILKEKYPSNSTDIPELNRTKRAIRGKAQRLGLSTESRWSKNEVSVLKEKYEEHGSNIPELHRTKKAIFKKAHKLGISNKINHITVSSELEEYLDGLLLGDGSLYSRESGNVSYCHSDSFKEYIVWLKGKLEELGLPCREVYKSGSVFKIKSIVTPELRQIYGRWYPNGEKQIPQDLTVTPTILKNWYVGDGSYYKRENDRRYDNLYIASLFDREGKQRLVRQLNEDISIKASNIVNGVWFSTKTRHELFDFMLSNRPEIPPGYKYKFPDKYIEGL